MFKLLAIPLLIAAGSKIYTLAKKANAGNKLIFTLAAVNNWKMKITSGLTFDVKIKLFNPTKESIKLTWAYLDVYLDSTWFTQINYTTEINILPEKEVIINIPVKINWLDLGNLVGTALYEFLQSGKKPKSLFFDGYIKTEGYSLPVDNLEVEVL